LEGQGWFSQNREPILYWIAMDARSGTLSFEVADDFVCGEAEQTEEGDLLTEDHRVAANYADTIRSMRSSPQIGPNAIDLVGPLRHYSDLLEKLGKFGEATLQRSEADRIVALQDAAKHQC
jgi:hypothetical protein